MNGCYIKPRYVIRILILKVGGGKYIFVTKKKKKKKIGEIAGKIGTGE
jgi:hypothetical protein